jgi:peptidoglycan-associated lipoprotein
MHATTTLTLLIVLTLGVGCQSSRPTAPPPSSLSSERQSTASAAAGTEVPDSDALSSGSEVPPPEQFVEVPRLQDIHFDYDSHELRIEDLATLDQNAAWLKANPGALLLIEGHTDERGTSEYNLGLGDLRASAAKRYLMDQGVASTRMVAISYGKERPLCTGHTESCWAQNRRAHFLAKPRLD